jgi:predicted O-methyltransferase YrrM
MNISTAGLPATWRAIKARSEAFAFDMPSDAITGALLRTLAAAKPGGRLLELGAGTGLATACLADGMDAAARLIAIDSDARVLSVAQAILGDDRRITFLAEDAGAYLRGGAPGTVDLIFADAMPGKYEDLDAALALLAPGGLYVVDDLLPQPNWPAGHQPRVDALLADLSARADLAVSVLPVGTGHLIATRRAPA